MDDLQRRSRTRFWLCLRLAACALATVFIVAESVALGADEAPRATFPAFKAAHLLESGGVVGLVIGAMSVFMVALVLEHLFSLRHGATLPRKLAQRVHECMQQRQYEAAAEECRGSRSLLAFVLTAGLTEIESGYAAVEKAMEDACAQYAARLYRKIDYLSVIGTLAPMLGLLGTVWGMMIAFSEFASKPNVAITELAPGISTALVTTLLGLAVAIPAYAAFAYFRNRIDEAVVTCSQVADHLFLDFRRAQAVRRRESRARNLKFRSAGDFGRPTIPSVTIEREKSA